MKNDTRRTAVGPDEALDQTARNTRQAGEHLQRMLDFVKVVHEARRERELEHLHAEAPLPRS
jgi:hypothetical protein